MLTSAQINELVVLHIFEDHTQEMIEEIHEILAKHPPEKHLEIWEQNGVYNYAEDMNDVFLILNDPKFGGDWRLDYESADCLYDAEVEYEGEYFAASADHPAKALCLAALYAVGAIARDLPTRSEREQPLTRQKPNLRAVTDEEAEPGNDEQV